MGMRVDGNILNAVRNFFRYGWGPGSCTELLLMGKYEEARTKAHPNIRHDKIWEDHIKFIETCVPLCCKGENTSKWRGYITELREDPAFESMMLLTVADPQYVKFWGIR